MCIAGEIMGLYTFCKGINQNMNVTAWTRIQPHLLQGQSPELESYTHKI